MKDFCLRLLIQPRKGVYDLEVSIAAIPISLDELRHVQADSDLLSLPCVRVWHCVGQHSVIFPGQARATNGDGLPAYPILVGPEPVCPTLDTALVREAMYAHWQGNDSLNMVSLADWQGLMFPAGGAAPILHEFNATYSWPHLSNNPEGGGGLGR